MENRKFGEASRNIQYFSNLFFIFSNFCGSGTDFVGKARGGTGAGVGKSEIWRGLEKYSVFSQFVFHFFSISVVRALILQTRPGEERGQGLENRNFGEASRNIQYFVNLFFNFFSNFCGSGTDFVDKARGGTGAGVGKSEIWRGLEKYSIFFQFVFHFFQFLWFGH